MVTHWVDGVPVHGDASHAHLILRISTDAADQFAGDMEKAKRGEWNYTPPDYSPAWRMDYASSPSGLSSAAAMMAAGRGASGFMSSGYLMNAAWRGSGVPRPLHSGLFDEHS